MYRSRFTVPLECRLLLLVSSYLTALETGCPHYHCEQDIFNKTQWKRFSLLCCGSFLTVHHVRPPSSLRSRWWCWSWCRPSCWASQKKSGGRPDKQRTGRDRDLEINTYFILLFYIQPLERDIKPGGANQTSSNRSVWLNRVAEMEYNIHNCFHSYTIT